ncbi:MAG: hypothetical protein HQ565_11205 [Bacteroidetes bacterium]|nr:hypothetical protein [Bacteroidota bacterium]
MKGICIFLLGLLICTTSIGQSDHLTLYKLSNTNKTKKIKVNKAVKIGKSLLMSDSLESTKWINGKFLKVSGDSIILKTDVIRINHKFTTNQKTVSTGESTRFNAELTDAQAIQSIAFSDIDFISSKSRHDEFHDEFLTAGLWLSVITTFIVAPLVSINYTEGTFNANTYKNYALAGTACFALSVTISFLTNDTPGYQINPDWPEKKKKKKKLWKFGK